MLELTLALDPAIAPQKDIVTAIPAKPTLAHNLHFTPENDGPELPKESSECAQIGHQLTAEFINPLEDGSFHDLTNFGQPGFGFGFKTKH